MPKLCEFEVCRKQACYGNCYGKPARCKEHKGEYKLVSQLCHEENCNVFSCYNYHNESKPEYCFEHKKYNMIDVKNKSKNCKFDNCNTRATYNYENECKGIYCVKHKLENMINVIDIKRICEYNNCKIRSSFNYFNLPAKFCKLHKIEGMIDVENKKCEYNLCKKTPNFNYKNQITPKFCCEHKLEGMVDVVHKTCCFPDCKTQPVFNFINEKPKFCCKHKLEGMVDTKNKKCKHENCIKQCSFNFDNEKYGIYCLNHKENGMIDVINQFNICSYDNCKNRPSYNYKGETKGIYCSTHKKEYMINVKNKKCKANLCLGTSANPKYKGYCSSCYQHLFPNDPLTLQMYCKTKEIAVRDYINLNFEGFQHDNPLWTGNCECTHRRKIDHRKLIGNTLLCIETDERQHKYYDKDDEEIRYNDLYMLHGGKFIFIRFNPDKFKDKNSKSLNPMLYTRLPFLKEEIEKQINRIENGENKELLEIIKLYYDEIKN
jgi:hypothetical protein